MEKHAQPPAAPEASPIEVRVAFAAGPGPVSGFVGDPAAPTSFHGWLELMDALEAARSAPPGATSPSGS
jgi:hypothetical protein